MKWRLIQSFKLCLIISTLVLGACGKKNNRVNSLVGSTPFYTGNPALAANPQIITQVQSIKANVACMNGYRLLNDVSFYVNGPGSPTFISGSFQPGFMTNGTIGKMWVGVSAFRDLMFVTQVTNGGGQVLGFNVTLSYCEQKLNTYSYSNVPSIISNERGLINFLAPNGIFLSSTANCGYNVVTLAANTFITSQRNMSDPYSAQDVVIPTSFAPPRCNGQF